MKEIPLTHGKVAIVDDDMYEWLSQWDWYASRSRNTWYAKRSDGTKRIRMHREIMRAPEGVLVDHRDGDGLHNWRENLRNCTDAQNKMNRKVISANNTSGYKGVSWSKKKRKWIAQSMINKKHIFIGHFSTPEEAARAYDEKARELFGEFARTNFK